MPLSFIPSRDRGMFGGPLDEARVRAYWDSMSPSYAPDADHGLVRFSHHRQHGAVLRLARPQRGERVLDAGAGSGLLSRRLVEAGCEVTAVDSSPAMVEQLRGVCASAVLAKLEELDLGDERFDHVLAIGVLNFVTDPEGTMRRLCKPVKPGGTLVLQVTEWSVFGLVYWLNYVVRGFEPFLFTRRWLTDRTAEHGFRPAGYEHPLPHDLTIAFKRDVASG
jgi:2-polyprenyl-3-methyl-5-hydroxy-6-metoxy-1,4-benzoquinol methylase